MKKILVIYLFLSVNLLAQKQKGEYTAPFIKNNKYLSYLFFSDSTTQSSLFNLRYQYLYIPSSRPFRRGGTSFTLGINLARFFSRKFIFGLCIDSRLFFSGLTRQHFSSEFINDFNSNYNSKYLDFNDSLRSEVLYNGINGSDSYYVKGSYPAYYGISFSPYPQKYGGFLLEVKYGGSSFTFFGNYPSQLQDKYGEKAELLFNTKKNITVELSFKPYKFFNQKTVRVIDASRPKDIFNFIVVSLYYERFSLVGSTFANIELNTFVNQSFISKYSSKNYLGIKLGLGLY